MNGDGRHDVSRRDFLWRTTSGAAAIGIGALGADAIARAAKSAATQPAVPKPILPYGKLGRTNYPVTLVSFGAILLKENVGSRVLQLAIDRGINLVHTSASYGRGGSIAACGELFKAAPAYRDKVFLCLKSYSPEKESEVDDMLRKLGTDRADVVLTELHSPDARKIDAIRKQQDNLKRKGKVRHTGFVCHGGMNEVIELVLDKHSEHFDVALLAMRVLPDLTGGENKADEAGRRFLKNLKAMRKAGIGILSMKSGARKAVTTGASVYKAHIKAYLEAGIDSMLTSLDTLDQVDLVTKLELKSTDLTPDERRAAADLYQAESGVCRMCAECRKACPRGLPVNDLMRFRMYSEHYGWHEHARAEYAASGVDFQAAARLCGDCTRCTEVCPIKLAHPRTIRETADLLG